MPPRDPVTSMWAEACTLLDQAERLRRQFFQPMRTTGGCRPTWQAPVDIYEGEGELIVVVALPGVRPDQVDVMIDGGLLAVAGERSIPKWGRARIRRLEIPHGRFERHVQLPAGLWQVQRNDLTDGCLVISLGKIR